MPRGRTVDLRWNALLNDFRRSGLTQAEFCRRRQISLHSFRKHLYQPRPPSPPPATIVPPPLPTTHFLPVTILPDPIPSITASHIPPRTDPLQRTSDRRRARIRPPDPPPSHRRRGGTPMFGLSAAVRVYLATKPADMRKSFDGLSALVVRRPRARSPLRSSLRLRQQATRSHQDPVLGPRRPGRLGQAARTRDLPHPGRRGRSRRDDHRRTRRSAGRHRPEHGPTAASATPGPAPLFKIRRKLRQQSSTRQRSIGYDHPRATHSPTTSRRPISSSASCWRRSASRSISTTNSSTSSNNSSASATAGRASGSTPLSSCSSPRRSWRRPSPRRRPLRHPEPAPTPDSRECAAQEGGPRPQAAAGEPAPQAGPARRPARTTRLPRLRRRADLHRRGSPRATRIRPRVAGRARARPPEICLPGLRGQRRDRRAAPRADREGAARPGAAGSRRGQQVCRSLAALSPGRDLPAVTASSSPGRRCATGWPSPPSCWSRSSS